MREVVREQCAAASGYGWDQRHRCWQRAQWWKICARPQQRKAQKCLDTPPFGVHPDPPPGPTAGQGNTLQCWCPPKQAIFDHLFSDISSDIPWWTELNSCNVSGATWCLWFYAHTAPGPWTWKIPWSSQIVAVQSWKLQPWTLKWHIILRLRYRGCIWENWKGPFGPCVPCLLVCPECVSAQTVVTDRMAPNTRLEIWSSW